MNTLRKRALTALICAVLVLAAYHAWRLPFYEYAEEIYTTTKDRLFTLDWLLHLIPLLIILGLSATAIMISIAARERCSAKIQPQGALHQPAPNRQEGGCPDKGPPLSWSSAGFP